MLLKQNFLLAFFKNFKQDGAGNLRERKATQKTNEKKKRFATGTFKNYARSEGRWVGTPISTCMCREGVFLNFKTSTRYSISNFLQKNCCGEVK